MATNVSIAKKIFTTNLIKLQEGEYKQVDELRPYKAFRQETISAIASKISSPGDTDTIQRTASTMYNTIRKSVVAANPQLEIILKRDKAIGRPKKGDV